VVENELDISDLDFGQARKLLQEKKLKLMMVIVPEPFNSWRMYRCIRKNKNYNLNQKN
jgi:hypothetical protein